MSMGRRLAVAVFAVSAAACHDGQDLPTESAAAPRPSLEIVPGTAADIQESLTFSGDPVVGASINLQFNLTNAGTQDFVPTGLYFGEVRPRAAFAEVVIPAGFKRQVPAANLQTDNPVILCEAYRGTHGGLSQSLFSDACRIWFYGPIPAGATVTATIPVKLLAEGDFSPWGGAEVYSVQQSGPMTLLNGGNWISTPIHVSPPPPKVGGGGGGGGGGAVGTALPDLQAGVRASTGSPAVGAAFSVQMIAKNIGKADALNPGFSATIPAGTTITAVGYDWGSCSVSGQVVTCVGDRSLPAGGAATVTLSLAAPGLPGGVTIGGTFTADNPEISLTNNAASVTVTVK